MKKGYKPDFSRPELVYVEYHRRELWNFLKNLYTWEGMPESVDVRYFNEILLTTGFAPLFKYGGEILTSYGAASGLDKYLRDTTFRVSNPFLKGVKRTVGDDCCLCFNTLNYRCPESCEILVEIFARRLAQIDISLDVSLKNSRAALIVVADGSEDALKISASLDQIYHGDAAVLTTSTSWATDKQIFPLSPKDNIISAELADCRKNVMAEFYEHLGINTVAVDKKERTNLAEMSSNDQQLYINALRMDEARQVFCDECKTVLGLNLKCIKNKPEEVTANVESMSKTGVDTAASARADIRD